MLMLLLLLLLVLLLLLLFIYILTQVSTASRRVLVQWLTSVHHCLKLCQDTLHLAVNIIDRVLDVMQVSRDCLELLGITCLLVASKQVMYIINYSSLSISYVVWHREYTTKMAAEEGFAKLLIVICLASVYVAKQKGTTV